MTAGKSERLLNLLIMLLVQRHYVAKERIREILYPDSTPDAFEKMFERDKDVFAVLASRSRSARWMPSSTTSRATGSGPTSSALPDISLTADEAAVVGLATKVWQHARLAEATTEAVRELTALGVDVDLTALDIVEPRLTADEPSFDVFWEATQERTPVVFDYVRSGDTEVRTRHLQPWGVARYSGRRQIPARYHREAERIFRLSRVQGRATKHGRSGSVEIPAGTDVSEVARRLAPEPSTERVGCWAQGAGHTLRRGADRVEEGVAGPDADSTWDRLVLERGSVGLADEVLGYGADVYVEEPAQLHDRVVRRLRATVGGPEAAA